MPTESTCVNATWKRLAASFVLVLTVGACGASAPTGHATIVQWDKQGGTLALRGDDAQAREDAKARMTAYCKGDYEVLSIERVKVGESTTHAVTSKTRDNNQTEGVVPNRTVTNEQQVTNVANIYETQVTYVCTRPSEAKQIETETPKTSR